VTRSDCASMISALFVAATDVNVFYLSEYHPQGIATAYLLMILYGFFKLISSGDYRFLGLGIVLSMAFALSHYFTPLYWALVFIILLPAIKIANLLLRKLFKSDKDLDLPQIGYVYMIISISIISFYFIINSDYNTPLIQFHVTDLIVNVLSSYKTFFILISFATIVIFSIIFIYKMYWNGAIKPERYHNFHSWLRINSSIIGILITFYLLTIIFYIECNYSYIAISRLYKWILLILSLSTIAKISIYNKRILAMTVLYGIITISAILGTLIIPSFPTDRLIGFWLIPAAPLASLTIIRLSTESNPRSKFRKYLFILIPSIIVIAGLLSSQPPAFFLQNPNVDGAIWYSNILPKMEEYKSAGEWTGKFIPYYENIQIMTEFHTRILPFFFGKRSINNIDHSYNGSNIYRIINPKSTENPFSHELNENEYNQIYNSNNINIYKQAWSWKLEGQNENSIY
jgi:hypothetical protein